jgi:hypothetical protein
MRFRLSRRVQCPADCGYTDALVKTSCAKCGDGQCQKSCGENATSCPADCGGGGIPKLQ